jgi:hypothetical protein
MKCHGDQATTGPVIEPGGEVCRGDTRCAQRTRPEPVRQLPWSQATQPDGTVIAIPVEQDASWYVDQVTTRRR